METDFIEWWNYYFAKSKEWGTEDFKRIAYRGWAGKRHLDFMRSEDDKPLWLKCVESKENE